jgi:AraC-like DNA-binding protein
VFWLSREIKKRLGKTYKALIQEKRVRQAMVLLEASDLGVAEIAERVGYSNTSYFHRLFFDAVGCTPRAYRVRGR